MSKQCSEGVSILLAMYNGADFIVAQLESIIAQAAADDEILVLDDCSTDESYAIVKHMENHHPGLRVMRNTHNMGVVATFQALLALANKDIIFLSDQDDVWLENRKSQMLRLLDERTNVAVLANAHFFRDGVVMHQVFADKYQPNTKSYVHNFIKNSFIGCCMALRREVLVLALPFPNHISMHDWWLGNCAMAIGRVAYSDKPSLLYRRHSSNLSPGTSRKLWPVTKDRLGNLKALSILAVRSIIFKIRRKSSQYA